MPHVNKQMISFFLTTKCNLNCIYCYNKEERKKIKEMTLPFEIAKAGIDYFFKNYCSRHIRFYGPGEPTQEFELMKEITFYAKGIDSNVTVEIQTNGVFSKKVREWMLENANIIWMSFDGPPDIQNFNRPIGDNHSSATIIEENVKWLIKNRKNKDLMVGARVTMTDKNIFRQKEMVDYFHSIGIKYIWTNPLFPTVGKIPVCNDLEKIKGYAFDMDSYLDYYIDAYYYAKEQDIFYGSFLTCNFDGEANVHCRSCTPVPHLTPDGYISACDMVVLGENAYHMDCFIYGKWNAQDKKFDFDVKKIEALRKRTSDNLPHCKECPAKLHCGGYCLGEVVNETGDLCGQKPIACKAIRRLIKEIGITDKPYKYLHP